MNPKVEIINPINYPGWDDLLLSTQDCSFFHSSAWAKVLTESYSYKPLYFTIFNKKRLLGLIPLMEVKSILTGHRGISLPFSDYCEPIMEDQSQFHNLFNHIIDYGKRYGWKYIELRGGKKFLEDISPSSYYYWHTLDLMQNEEKIFSGFRDSTRRNIKKALKEDVELRTSYSLESVKEFYRLHCMTRKHHGLPSQPFYFFKSVYHHIISKNQGVIVLASHNHKVIAGALYFHFAKSAVYKYGASDRTYQNLRANNLVMWEAIRMYTNSGYKNFCFGRTEPKHRGLLQFKNGWNTAKRMMNYYRYDLRKGTMVKGKSKVLELFNPILSKMPINFLNFIGTTLYKHMG